MGQKTVGVMYGAAIPSGVALWDDDSDEGGLLDKYPHDEPRTDETFKVVGYFAHRSIHRAFDKFEPISIEDVARRLTEGSAGEEAIREWKRFSKWAAKLGVKFEEPRFWVVECEVA